MRLIYVSCCILIISCSTSSVEDDMKEYCDCIYAKGSSNKDCITLSDDILVKYEYDDEAATYIEEELNKCKGNN